MTACSSYLNQELLLHDWWLIKVNSGCPGERLGVGGFASRESHGIRCFASAPIVKRHDAVTLLTADGITVMVNGHLNKALTLENGFSYEVCDHFVIGFPYCWEEFAVMKEAKQEPHSAVLERIPFSYGRHKMPESNDFHHRDNSIEQTSKVSTPNNSNWRAVNQYTGCMARRCKSLHDWK